MRRRTDLLVVALTFLCGSAWEAASQEIRPGVSAARQIERLPLRTQGHEVYLLGEFHGLQENEEVEVQYLRQLHRASGLRDVAIEEDAVYEPEAQAFVDGRADALPLSLCLRAAILSEIRRFNIELKKDQRIRVHLIDVDSPSIAIRQHLVAIKKRLGATKVSIPEQTAIKEHGIETVAQLTLLTTESSIRSELRTIKLSILTYQQGLEIDIGPQKGNAYLDSREEAIASNIVDLIRIRKVPSLLVLYGSDHLSKTPRRDGGPNRDQRFTPVAFRLEQAGIRAFSLVMFPLAGRSFWRGQAFEFPWTAEDGRLASGETLDRVLSAVPGTQFLYVDAKIQHARLPRQGILSNIEVDAFLLFRSGTPMRNQCVAR